VRDAVVHAELRRLRHGVLREGLVAEAGSAKGGLYKR
jgi:hypothetical protein